MIERMLHFEKLLQILELQSSFGLQASLNSAYSVQHIIS